jgi:hypothetical protein
MLITYYGSRDSSVGIATGWVRFPAVQDFLFSTASRPTLGPTQPLMMGAKMVPETSVIAREDSINFTICMYVSIKDVKMYNFL